MTGILRGLTMLFLLALSGCEGLAISDTASLLAPGFQRSEVLGIVAGFGTTFAAVPDLLAMIKRRSSKGMNPRMAARHLKLFEPCWAPVAALAQRPWFATGLM
jgi:hypothetical protein